MKLHNLTGKDAACHRDRFPLLVLLLYLRPRPFRPLLRFRAAPTPVTSSSPALLKLRKCRTWLGGYPAVAVPVLHCSRDVEMQYLACPQSGPVGQGENLTGGYAFRSEACISAHLTDKSCASAPGFKGKKLDVHFIGVPECAM